MQRQQTLYPNLIIDALRQVRYPGNGQNIVDLDMVEDLSLIHISEPTRRSV